MKKLMLFVLFMSPVNVMAATEAPKAVLQPHAYMVRTFLDSSLVFLDGLDRQLKTDVSIGEAEIARHLDIYTAQTADTLKNARVHLIEYLGALNRAPASGKEGGNKNVNEARTNLDQAIGLNDTLAKHLRDSHQTGQLGTLRDEVSLLKSHVKSIASEVKSLKYAD